MPRFESWLAASDVKGINGRDGGTDKVALITGVGRGHGAAQGCGKMITDANLGDADSTRGPQIPVYVVVS
ncbi:MAG: hypothetical protein R3C14_50840 [Caldilineaceae bacterium]